MRSRCNGRAGGVCSDSRSAAGRGLSTGFRVCDGNRSAGSETSGGGAGRLVRLEGGENLRCQRPALRSGQIRRHLGVSGRLRNQSVQSAVFGCGQRGVEKTSRRRKSPCSVRRGGGVDWRFGNGREPTRYENRAADVRQRPITGGIPSGASRRSDLGGAGNGSRRFLVHKRGLSNLRVVQRCRGECNSLCVEPRRGGESRLRFHSRERDSVCDSVSNFARLRRGGLAFSSQF